MTPAQQKMIQWLQKNDPFLYDVAIKNYQMKTGGLNGLFDNFDFAKFASSVTSAASKIAGEVANIKVLNANIKRAQQGIAPITTADYMPSNPNYLPNSPEGQYAVNYAAQSLNRGFDMMSLLPFLAIGAVGFMLIKKARG